MTQQKLNRAETTIQGLQNELAQAQADALEARQTEESLQEENAELYRRLQELTPPPEVPPLAGVRIGIIGHPGRQEDYRAVVERQGGQLLFAEANGKLGQIDRVVQKAHGTVFLTSWASHQAFDRAVAAAERYGRPLILCDRPGLAAVEQVILAELLPRIREE